MEHATLKQQESTAPMYQNQGKNHTIYAYMPTLTLKKYNFSCNKGGRL